MKTPIEKLLEIITLKEKENAIYLMPIIDKIDIDKLISEEKQLLIHSVSHRRELLIAFTEFVNNQLAVDDMFTDEWIDDFLSN